MYLGKLDVTVGQMTLEGMEGGSTGWLSGGKHEPSIPPNEYMDQPNFRNIEL